MRVIDNEMHSSVVGLEITVSNNVEVKEKRIYDNTVGVGFFHQDAAGNLPLPVMTNWVLEQNHIYANNRDNEAPEGSFQKLLPPGVGVLMLGVSGNVIAKNTVENNAFVGIGVLGWCTAFPQGCPPSADPAVNDNRITQNTVIGNGFAPVPLAADITYFEFEGSSGNCFEKNKPDWFTFVSSEGTLPTDGCWPLALPDLGTPGPGRRMARPGSGVFVSRSVRAAVGSSADCLSEERRVFPSARRDLRADAGRVAAGVAPLPATGRRRLRTGLATAKAGWILLPNRVGSVLLIVEVLHGRRHAIRARLTAVVPARRLAYRFLGPVSVLAKSGEFLLQPEGEGTRFTAVLRFRCFAPLFRGRLAALRRHVAEEGASLERMVETGEPGPEPGMRP